MQNNPWQILNLISQSPNPNALLAQMYGNHPQYQKIMNLIKGKTPQEIEQYVKNLCQTQGIDIQSLARRFNLPL